MFQAVHQTGGLQCPDGSAAFHAVLGAFGHVLIGFLVVVARQDKPVILVVAGLAEEQS